MLGGCDYGGGSGSGDEKGKHTSGISFVSRSIVARGLKTSRILPGSNLNFPFLLLSIEALSNVRNRCQTRIALTKEIVE